MASLLPGCRFSVLRLLSSRYLRVHSPEVRLRQTAPPAPSYMNSGHTRAALAQTSFGGELTVFCAGQAEDFQAQPLEVFRGAA
jgi:hypothetical protein